MIISLNQAINIMEEKFKYFFDDSTRILYKYYYGTITLEDIYSSWDYAISNNLISKETLGFILDYRNATFDIEIKQSSGIADYFKEHLDIFGNQKIAIITQTPKDIVIPLLVGKKDEGYSTQPFYTIEAAIRWILDLI